MTAKLRCVHIVTRPHFYNLYQGPSASSLTNWMAINVNFSSTWSLYILENYVGYLQQNLVVWCYAKTGNAAL